MSEVYVAELTEWLEQGLPEEAVCKLSASRRERWKGNRGFLQSAAAELLLKKALSLRGIPVPADWSWIQDEDGKPRIRGLEGVEFNLSHSGRYAACILGDSPVGVDVQVIRDGGKIAERRFLPEEQEAMTRSSDPTETFCRIWTAKEAYLKMLGTGLRRSLASFQVDLEEGRIMDSEIPGAGCHLTWLPVWPGQRDAVLAACGREACVGKPVYLRAEELF